VSWRDIGSIFLFSAQRGNFLTWLDSDKLNKWADTISKIGQVVALLVAGWWAYMNFSWMVKPSLVYGGNLDTQLNWTATNGDTCQGSLRVTVTNGGTKDFDLVSVHLRGWLYTSEDPPPFSKQVEIEKPTSTRPVLVDYNMIESNPPFIAAMYTAKEPDIDLIGNYPPKKEHIHSWDWVFKKTAGQAVLFKVEVNVAGEDFSKSQSSWITHDTCSVTLQPDVQHTHETIVRRHHSKFSSR